MTNIHTGDLLGDIELAGPIRGRELKTLIVGSEPKSIGFAYQDFLENNTTDDVFAPGLGMFDVLKRDTVFPYIRKNGPFDRILYSAGINQLKWIEDMNQTDLSKHMAINVWGFVDVVKAHRYFWGSNKLSMVVIVSDAADTPMRGSLAYCTSKAAALMAMRCLARECHDWLRIVSVSPGVVSRTGMTESVDKQVQDLRGWSAEEAYAYETQDSLVVGRVSKADVCQTIQFAFDGPRHLHGTDIKVNGGR